MLIARCYSPAAERLGAPEEVVGIDFTDAMIEAASEGTAGRGLKVHVSVMDTEVLSFPDASFDCVTRCFGMVFSRGWDRTLAHLRRMRKPGERFAIATGQVRARRRSG